MPYVSSYLQSTKIFRLTAFYGLTLIAVFLIDAVGWSQPLKRVVAAGITPISEQSGYVVRTILTPLSRIARSYRSQIEYERLQSQHAALLAQLTQLENVEEENKVLRQMIQNRHLDLSERIVAAAISSYAQPTISAGAEHGVRTGQLVMHNGLLLGRVRQVSDRQATIELLGAQSVDDPLLVEVDSGSQGVISGRGKYATVTHVSRTAEVKQGERVVSLGQPGIPAGVLLGTVGQIVSSPSEPFLTFRLDQPESFYSVALVEVW